MTQQPPEIRSIIIEREIAHPPEKVWRALTLPHLMEEWLMRTDFEPVVDHRFGFSADWGVVECRVLEVQPQRSLSYTWGDHDLSTVVTWTLTPTLTGTHLRMEQSGFKRDQPRYFHGAKAGWPRFFTELERVLECVDVSQAPQLDKIEQRRS